LHISHSTSEGPAGVAAEIIARDYSLPCVTGVPDATALTEMGETVTLDGYLGTVTVLR
jgi:phosphohistidine swiveling domain-containing protein